MKPWFLFFTVAVKEARLVGRCFVLLLCLSGNLSTPTLISRDRGTLGFVGIVEEVVTASGDTHKVAIKARTCALIGKVSRVERGVSQLFEPMPPW